MGLTTFTSTSTASTSSMLTIVTSTGTYLMLAILTLYLKSSLSHSVCASDKCAYAHPDYRQSSPDQVNQLLPYVPHLCEYDSYQHPNVLKIDSEVFCDGLGISHPQVSSLNVFYCVSPPIIAGSEIHGVYMSLESNETIIGKFVYNANETALADEIRLKSIPDNVLSFAQSKPYKALIYSKLNIKPLLLGIIHLQ